MKKHNCFNYITTAEGIEFWCSFCGKQIAGPKPPRMDDTPEAHKAMFERDGPEKSADEPQVTNYYVTAFCLYEDDLQPYTTSVVSNSRDSVQDIMDKVQRQCDEDNGSPSPLIFAGICEGDVRNWI